MESLLGEEFIAVKVDGSDVHPDMLVKAKRVRSHAAVRVNGDEVKARFFSLSARWGVCRCGVKASFFWSTNDTC